MKYVLFVCNHNAGRSQMAQAFFERDAPAQTCAPSRPARRPRAPSWPEVVEVMRDVGIDLADRRPKKLLREMQLHADWAVTMGSGDACRYVTTTVEDWDILDPAGRPIEEVRAIRDQIAVRVGELIDTRPDAIRADRTAHQVRLAHEFEGRRSPEDIRVCADAVRGRDADVPVRSYVATLAHRQTRECLTADTCDALAVAP